MGLSEDILRFMTIKVEQHEEGARHDAEGSEERS